VEIIMNYRDTLVVCQECGKQFIFTVEKQRQMSEKGLDVTPPDLCDTCTQRVKHGGRLHGRIRWFDPGKGYGFIADDAGKDLFFHRTGVILTEAGSLPPLEEGQEVLFEVTESPKGPQATGVTLYHA
jgi:CspA family cold shock protein